MDLSHGPKRATCSRMASDAPEAVADIILYIPYTDNISVRTDLADAACAILGDHSIRLIDLAKRRASGPYASLMLPPEKMGRLIGRLAHNVSDALLLRSRRWDYPIPEDPQEVWPKRTRPPQPEPEPTPLNRARWEAVQEQRRRGLTIRGIARELGMSRSSIRKYLASDRPPVCAPRRSQPTRLTPHLDYLRGRWAEGCHNARQLYRELVQRGYQG